MPLCYAPTNGMKIDNMDMPLKRFKILKSSIATSEKNTNLTNKNRQLKGHPM